MFYFKNVIKPIDGLLKIGQQEWLNIQSLSHLSHLYMQLKPKTKHESKDNIHLDISYGWTGLISYRCSWSPFDRAVTRTDYQGFKR
jgi:hypothetical protein